MLDPSPGRRALGLVPAVVAARGVALLVPLAVTWVLGAGAAADAWFGALAAPTVALVVVANAVALGFLPALSRSMHEGDVRRAVRAAVGWALGASVVASAVLLALAPRTGALAVGLLPWCAVAAAATVARVICELRGAFQVSALAPVARAAVVLVGVLAAGPRAAWYPLVWLGGAVAELGILARAAGRIAPGAGAPSPVGFGPLVAGESLVASSLLVDRAFAASIGPGVLTVLEVADRVRLVPQSLLESTWLPVSFAGWARLAHEPTALAGAVASAMRQVAAVSAPILGALWIARFALLDAMALGAFTPDKAELAARVVGAWLPGLWALPLAALGVRANALLGRSRAIAALGAWAFAVNLLGNALLTPRYGAPGLALASSVTSATVALWHLGLLRDLLRRARPWAWAPALACSAAAAGVALAFGGRDPGEARSVGLALEALLLAGAVGYARGQP